MDNDIKLGYTKDSIKDQALQQKGKNKHFPYVILSVCFLLLQTFFIFSNRPAIFKFIYSFVLIYIFIAIIIARRSVSLKKILSRYKFYPLSLLIAVIFYPLANIFLFGLISWQSSEPLGLGGIAIAIGVLVIDVLLTLVSFVVYEITHYFVFKNNNDFSKNNVIDISLKSNTKVSIVAKLFSFILLIISFVFLFDYLKLFIQNYKYVKLLKFVNNLSDYKLNSLSVKEIFTSQYVFLIYFFIIICFITVLISIRNSKSTAIFISISLLLFVIAFIGKIGYGSHPRIYFNTVYQDDSFYMGKSNQGSARDILKADYAIREKDIKLCSQVGYVHFRNYCEKKLSSQ